MVYRLWSMVYGRYKIHKHDGLYFVFENFNSVFFFQVSASVFKWNRFGPGCVLLWFVWEHVPSFRARNTSVSRDSFVFRFLKLWWTSQWDTDGYWTSYISFSQIRYRRFTPRIRNSINKTTRMREKNLFGSGFLLRVQLENSDTKLVFFTIPQPRSISDSTLQNGPNIYTGFRRIDISSKLRIARPSDALANWGRLRNLQ